MSKKYMRKFIKNIFEGLKGPDDSLSNKESLVNRQNKNFTISKEIGYDSEATVVQDSEEIISDVETVEIKGSETTSNSDVKNKSVKNKKIPHAVNDNVHLKQLSIDTILQSMQTWYFGKDTVAFLKFHVKFNKEQNESKAVLSALSHSDFIDDLKVRLSNNGIKYLDNLSATVTFSSPDFESFTKITQWLSIEVLTPKQANKPIKAFIHAIHGILWSEKIELLPRKKAYNIGRCKNPELPSGHTITNDIAFVGMEEVENDPKFEINRYISRSIARIYYNENENTFKLMRSNLMDNSKHVIKIIREVNNGMQEIDVNNVKIEYPLQNEDQIVFNRKVSLVIEIIETN